MLRSRKYIKIVRLVLLPFLALSSFIVIYNVYKKEWFIFTHAIILWCILIFILFLTFKNEN